MDSAEETAGLVQSRGHFWSFSVKKVAAPTTVWRELAEDSLPPSLTASLPGHIPDCRPLHPGCHHLLCSHGHPAHLFPDLHSQGKLPTWGSKETMAACWTPGPRNLNTLAPGKRDQDASHKLIQTFFFFPIFIYFISLARSGLPCCTRDLSFRFTDPLVVAHGLSSSSACGILVPRPGIEPMSSALQGGFLTTGPPEKSPIQTFLVVCFVFFLSGYVRESLTSNTSSSSRSSLLHSEGLSVLTSSPSSLLSSPLAANALVSALLTTLHDQVLLQGVPAMLRASLWHLTATLSCTC